MKGIVAYVGIGEGYKSPALAVKDALEKRNCDVLLVNLFHDLGMKRTDIIVKNAWRLLLRYPGAHNILFGFTNAASLKTSHTSFSLMYHAIQGRLTQLMKSEKPDFIFSTN